jgi:hypothetical protein
MKFTLTINEYKMAKISLKEEVHKVLKEYDKMETYRIQEAILQDLLKKHPDHTNRSAVDTKVKLLNLFYSTGIQAVNKMTENILGIKDIDARLKEGDLSLIPEIAVLKLNDGERFNYSFATKYCALHQPAKFPIYDSIVAMTFISFFEKELLPKYKYSRRKSVIPGSYTKGQFSDKLKEYSFFVEVYDYFMEQYDLKSEFTYRQIDSYIWGAFKVAGPDYKIEQMAQLDKSKIIEYNI